MHNGTFFVAVDAITGSTTVFSKDEYRVYAISDQSMNTSALVTIPGADPATFDVLSSTYGSTDTYGYAKDKSHVYLSAEQISEADPSSFYNIWIGAYQSHYSADANHIFFANQVIPGADPATFHALDVSAGQYSCGPSCYYDAYDKIHKYQDGSNVSNI